MKEYLDEQGLSLYHDLLQREFNYKADNITMVGATSDTAGSAGLVPAPAVANNDKFLKGDGTWAPIAYEDVNYTVNTSSNTSGSVSIDGTIPVHVLTLSGNISSVSLSNNPPDGHSCHVIFTASSTYTIAIAHHSTSRICPNAEDILLEVPAGGYVEIDFFNVNNKIYVRGI